MVPSKRVAGLLVAIAAVAASFVFLVLSAADGSAALVAAPYVFAAVVGLLALGIGAAIANSLAGPDGPQGPDEPTGADRRREANEWKDPPGVDVDDDERDE